MVRWWRLRGGDLLRTAATAMWRRNGIGGYHTIDAVFREQTGPRAASMERATGRIPAVVTATGKDALTSKKLLITFDKHQIESLVHDPDLFTSTIFNLQILAGVGSTVVLQSGNVILVKVQKNVETGQVLNMKVVWVNERSEMKLHVPVVLIGEDDCPGLKKGGYLHKIRTSLKCFCPSEHIPQKIEVSIANLDIGDKICVRDIKAHPSLKLLGYSDMMPICKIHPTEPAALPHSEASSENTETRIAE